MLLTRTPSSPNNTAGRTIADRAATRHRHARPTYGCCPPRQAERAPAPPRRGVPSHRAVLRWMLPRSTPETTDSHPNQADPGGCANSVRRARLRCPAIKNRARCSTGHAGSTACAAPLSPLTRCSRGLGDGAGLLGDGAVRDRRSPPATGAPLPERAALRHSPARGLDRVIGGRAGRRWASRRPRSTHSRVSRRLGPVRSLPRTIALRPFPGCCLLCLPSGAMIDVHGRGCEHAVSAPKQRHPHGGCNGTGEPPMLAFMAAGALEHAPCTSIAAVRSAPPNVALARRVSLSPLPGSPHARRSRTPWRTGTLHASGTAAPSAAEISAGTPPPRVESRPQGQKGQRAQADARPGGPTSRVL